MSWRTAWKHHLFVVCPKTGRIVGVRADTLVFRVFLPFLGLLSLGWYLIRVLPKPLRSTYPCQRMAALMASGVLGDLFGSPLAVMAARLARRHWLEMRYMTAASGMAVAGIGIIASVRFAAVQSAAFVSSEGPNAPVGVARGIFPGRVVWVRNQAAAKWDGVTGKWWEDAGTDQAEVDRMLSAGLQSLAGAPDDAEAWERIFRHFNRSTGRGDVGHAAGEKIAIKINCNNSASQTDVDHHIDASPHSVLALLRQLVYGAGVAQTDIVVYEAPNTAGTSNQRVIPNRIFDKCFAEFPSVTYADCLGTNGRLPVTWTTGAMAYSVDNGCGKNLPTLLINATYLINMALFKGHSTAGVTLTAKNHYGSINAREHTYIRSATSGMGAYSPFVDLTGHRHLGGKTLLFMIDGLYGTESVGTTVNTQARSRWVNLFGGQWSASFFLSLDPVAIDSVGLDFLTEEFGVNLGGGNAANCDNYLHEAALAFDPPSGVDYRPNGATLPSLGVHEHWNNPVDKRYSRNLGTGDGIELVSIFQPPPCFMLEGGVDSTTYRVAENGAWQLFAAVRGSRLYVAGRATGTSAANDHFILVTDALGPLQPAPDGKAGMAAFDASAKPWLKQAGQTAATAWTNGGPSSRCAGARINSAFFEGSICMIEAFGAVPETVYLAFARYARASGGALVSADQVPAGNGNGNMEANEFLAVPVGGIRDVNLDGIPDVLDPVRDFAVGLDGAAGGEMPLVWPVLPGRVYRIEASVDMNEPFVPVGDAITAAAGQFVAEFHEPDPPAGPRRFYRVRLVEP